MKLVAIIMTYQCSEVILPCLQSIDGKVDEIMCFDGRWHGIEGPDHSDDGTDKVIEEFAKISKSKVSYIQLSVMHQHESRTESLKYLNNGDWGLIIDSDEYIVEWGDDVRKTLENFNEKVYRMHWLMYKPYALHLRYACIRKTETVHWSTDHRRVFDKDGEIDIVHAPAIHIVINHQSTSQTKKMRRTEESYKSWLLKYEQTHWNPEDKVP
jgi:hypothetical protein